MKSQIILAIGDGSCHFDAHQPVEVDAVIVEEIDMAIGARFQAA